jgi:hypothetical protein
MSSRYIINIYIDVLGYFYLVKGAFGLSQKGYFKYGNSHFNLLNMLMLCQTLMKKQDI